MEKLALLGGTKAVKKTLEEMAFPLVPEKAYKTVEDIMRKGEISTSPIVNQFEEKFRKYIGCEYGLCYVNGTTAIQSALFVAGVGAGDEVIVPSFTFWASVGPVVANKSIPVFADVDIFTQTLTAETIKKCITKRTKAILVVHVWGTPCDMDPIMALAKEYNIKVIEDCSHAHGAEYKGRKVGSIGDIGCFSLQGSKVLPAGEGGIMVTNSKEYYERAIALGHYERIKTLDDSSEYKKYILTGLGFKHRVHPIPIAIADAQLDLLDERNRIRKENALYFESLISDLDFIDFQKIPEGAERIYAYHYGTYNSEKLKGLGLYTFLEALWEEGVMCGSCSYGVLHKAPLYTEGATSPVCSFGCPCYDAEYKPAEYLESSECLNNCAILLAPRFENVTKEDIIEHANAYRKIVASVDELLEYEEKHNKDKKIVSSGRSISYFKN